MSENRDNEGPVWNEDEAYADKAVADLKRSMDRLRGHVGSYRKKIGDSAAEADAAEGGSES
jgi:hypothetical protein